MRRVLWGCFLSAFLLTGGSRTVESPLPNQDRFTTEVELTPGQVIIRELIWQTDDEIVATLETRDGLYQVQINCQSGGMPHDLKSIVPGTDRQLQVVQNVCHGKLG